MADFSLGEAVLGTSVDLDGLRDGLKGAQGVAGDLFGKIGDVVKSGLVIAAGLATAAIGGIAAGLSVAISEAIEAQEVQAQLNQVLESTNEIAGVTSEMANNLAASLQKVTRFSDDTILSAETMLLRFKNISKDVFPDATKTALDLATALKIDATSAAKLLGKALEEPGEGLNRLKQAGVSFTEEQEKMIAAMVEAGDTAGAQKFILEALGESVGGAAEAAGSTFAGRIDILKNSLLDMAEGIGLKLLPIGERLINEFILPAMPVIEQLAGQFASFIETIGQGDFSAFTALIPPDLMASLQGLGDAFGGLISAVMADGPAFQETAQKMLNAVATGLQAIGPDVIQSLANTVDSLTQIWAAHGETILAVISGTWQTVVSIITFAVGAIAALIESLVGLFAGWLDIFSLVFQGRWEEAWAMYLQVTTEFWATLDAGVRRALDAFFAVWGTSLTNVQTLISTKLMEMTAGFQTWVINTINWAKEQIPRFLQVGLDWFEGMRQGILLKVTQLQDTVVSAIKDTIKKAREALGIASPSRVFIEMGEQMRAGMNQGFGAAIDLPQMAMSTTTASIANTMSNTTNFNLTAQYGNLQSEASLRDDLALLQMMAGA